MSEETGHRQRTVRFMFDTAKMVLWRTVSIGVGAIGAVLIARWLGPEGRGVYALLLLWIGLAALVLQFGMPEASIYLLGAKLFPAERIITTLGAYYGGAALLGGLGAFLVTLFTPGGGAIRAVLVGVALAATIPMAGLRHVLLARQSFGRYSVSFAIEALVYLGCVIAFHAVEPLSVEAVLASYVAGLLTVLALLYRWTVAGMVGADGFSADVVRAAYLHGRHLFVTGLGSFAVQRIGYVLLEIFVGTRAVGQYAAASGLPILFANLPQQLGTVLYSHVSVAGARHGVLLTATVFKVLGICGAAVLVPVCWFREEIALLLFGAEFAGIGDALALLCIGMLVTGLAGLLLNALAGTGSAHFGTPITLTTFAVMTLAGLMLIPRFGLEGAALAQVSAAVLSLFVIGTIFCRKLGVTARALLVPSREELRVLLRRPGAEPGAS